MLRASASVRNSFNFVFDRIRSVMASADDNASQLPADPGFLTPSSRVVTRWAFRGIPCSEGQGPSVSRDEQKIGGALTGSSSRSQSSATWQNNCTERYE